MNPAIESIYDFLQYFIHLAWAIPFQIQFFMFPFTFGHVIYGLIFMDVAVYIFAKFFSNGKDFREK